MQVTLRPLLKLLNQKPNKHRLRLKRLKPKLKKPVILPTTLLKLQALLLQKPLKLKLMLKLLSKLLPSLHLMQLLVKPMLTPLNKALRPHNLQQRVLAIPLVQVLPLQAMLRLQQRVHKAKQNLLNLKLKLHKQLLRPLVTKL